MFISSLDIESDFWSDPQNKVYFKEEYKAKVPSTTMWALALDVHPLSKFSDLDSKTRKRLIAKDYLDNESFNFEDYKDISLKMINGLPTTAERFIATWNNKLHEINDFLNSVPYDASTYKMLTDIMKDFHPMMKQYREIEKEFSKQQEMQTHGSVEESLAEKKVI